MPCVDVHESTDPFKKRSAWIAAGPGHVFAFDDAVQQLTLFVDGVDILKVASDMREVQAAGAVQVTLLLADGTKITLSSLESLPFEPRVASWPFVFDTNVAVGTAMTSSPVTHLRWSRADGPRLTQALSSKSIQKSFQNHAACMAQKLK